MMSRIEAEGALSQRSAIAAGSGTMEERDQRQYVRELRRAANGGRAPKATKASVASLAQIGIQVITEEAKGGEK
jgi:hypothetical protein